MSEEVVRVLLGRVPPSSPALLPNHQRFSIRGRVYPAILPVDGNEVSGRTVLDLQDSSETMLAFAYIWGNVDDPDLYGEWDFDEWKKVYLKDYLTMTQDFKEELEQLEPKTDD